MQLTNRSFGLFHAITECRLDCRKLSRGFLSCACEAADHEIGAACRAPRWLAGAGALHDPRELFPEQATSN